MKLLDTAGKALNKVGAALARAVTREPHRCDPAGFYCDCARKAETNDRLSRQDSWLGPRRRDWVRRR